MPMEEFAFAAVCEVKLNDDLEIEESSLVISPWNESGRNGSYEEEPVKKCGDVIRTLSGKFAFICAACNCQYLDFQLFDDHFRDGSCGNEIYDCSESSGAGADQENFYANAESADESGDLKNIDVSGRCVERSILPATIQNGTRVLQKSKNRNIDKSAKNAEESKDHHKNGFTVEKIGEDNSSDRDSEDDEDENSQTIGEQKPKGPICARCCRIYRSENIFRTHLRRYHSNLDVKHLSIQELEQKLFEHTTDTVCKYCGKQFEDVVEFKTHLYGHSGSNIFACKNCAKTFARKSLRDLHMYTHQDLRPFACPYCNKSFSNPTNLRNHIKIHLLIKNFTCKYCGKGFVKGTDKRIHERIHTNEQPYQCEECGLRFISQIKLTEHIRRHRNIRNFKCSECDKAYYNQYQLRAHMTTHTKVRNFECLKCGKKFLQRKTLGQHMNIHSAVKKYVCQTCGKAFAQDAGLRAHIKTHGEPASRS